MIAASVLETAWMEAVATTGGPWCFISEAVIIYLEQAQARQAITQIANRFPGAWLLIDTTSKKMVDGQSTHDAMKYLPKESWFRWACNAPHEIEGWGNLRLVRSRTFLDADSEFKRHAPWPLGLMMRWTPWLIRGKLEGYRLNRFIIDN